MNEHDRIARFFAPLSGEGSFGLRDDAALISLAEGETLVTTVDSVIEGVHCFGTESPRLIAHKLVRRNLSDLAAMGARPRAYLLSLTLPRNMPEDWFTDFTRGLSECQDTFGIELLGGDCSSLPSGVSSPFVLSLTAFGVLTGSPLLRSGATIGDDVYVSGTIGDAALGLDTLQSELQLPSSEAQYLIGRYLLPEPRVRLGAALRHLATSCIDISDGLLQDAGHICTASQCGMALQASLLPLSLAAQHALATSPSMLKRIVTGGDDYELLFTAPPEAEARITSFAFNLEIPLTRIGSVVHGNSVDISDHETNRLVIHDTGFRHH